MANTFDKKTHINYLNALIEDGLGKGIVSCDTIR